MNMICFLLIVFTTGVCFGQSRNDYAYVRVNKMLTQPQAQEACSKLNGILPDFRSNILDYKDDIAGETYWAGLVYIEDIREYEFKNGYLASGIVKGNQNGGKFCVVAKLKNDGKPTMLQSSSCCDKRAYLICKVQKNGTVAGNSVNRIMVNITVDNSGKLITDSGEERDVVCKWDKVKHFTLAGNTKNVTIKAYNDEGKGGILASFSNKVVTDSSWECADMSACNADDCASWTSATPRNGLKGAWHESSQISSAAQWIWAKNEMATRVWCRKRFGKLERFCHGWTSISDCADNANYDFWIRPCHCTRN